MFPEVWSEMGMCEKRLWGYEIGPGFEDLGGTLPPKMMQNMGEEQPTCTSPQDYVPIQLSRDICGS